MVLIYLKLTCNWHFKECLHSLLHQACGIFLFSMFYGEGRQEWHVWMDNLILQHPLLPHKEIWLVYESALLFNSLHLRSGGSDLHLTSIKHQQSDFAHGHITEESRFVTRCHEIENPLILMKNKSISNEHCITFSLLFKNPL